LGSYLDEGVVLGQGCLNLRERGQGGVDAGHDFQHLGLALQQRMHIGLVGKKREEGQRA
jgi:hypothetical protein